MLLAVDIGNSNISCAVFKDKKIIRRFVIPVRAYRPLKISKAIGKLPVEAAILCSVVPRFTGTLKKDLRKILGGEPYIIGKDIKVPIKNLYRKPKEVGQDRLVNAYAGIMLYGAPLITLDLGTAITFDAVSRDREYLGGMILPGLELSLDALSEKTALLPRIKLTRPREFIGRDTRSSILSGMVYGFSGLTDHLIERIRHNIGRGALVIGTGGNIGLIARYSRKIHRIDRDLTLKGLNLIYRLQKKS